MKKKNVKNRMRPRRTVNLVVAITLTVVALVAVSVIGPTTNNSGKVRAFTTLPISLDQSEITAKTDPGIVPGTLSVAQYVSGTVLTGSTTSCDTLYTVDGSLMPDSALDHHWMQADRDAALIFDLGVQSSNAIVFPSIDHNMSSTGHPAFEALEFTVWGLPAGPITPPAFTPGAPWVLGKLERVYAQGWQPNNCSTLESDDYASVWQFLDASNHVVNVQFVAIYANESVLMTPFTSFFDDRNSPNAEINTCFSSGTYFCSDDAEIDGVATSSAIQGCIDPLCVPPPPPPTSTTFCSYTQGKFNDKAKNPVVQYVQNNFDTLFPSGLTIGVNDGAGPRHHATWTNVNNLRVYIGGGGAAGALTMDATNPTARSQTGGGVLASQVLALTLNIKLSGSGGGQPAGFGSLILCNTGNANLNGKSVQNILDQANLFLGGSPSYNLGLNASSLNALVNDLNSSWDDCVQSVWAQSYLCVPQQP